MKNYHMTQLGDSAIYTHNLDTNEEYFLAKTTLIMMAVATVIIIAHYSGLVDYLIALV